MEKMGLFKAYGRMWKNIFNYHDTADRREYWLSVLINAIVGVLGAACAIISVYSFNSDCWMLLAWVLIAFFGISLVPFVSLTVRRLHDTGRSGWWTCLLLAVGVGTLWLLLMCASTAGASFNPAANQSVDVYGPPEWFNEFSPERNEEAGVYGSPNWDDEEHDPMKDASESDYDPSQDIPEPVYGPPSWFDGSETEDN